MVRTVSPGGTRGGRAAAVAERDDERKLVIDVLKRILTPTSLAMAESYLDDDALRPSACGATIAIAERLVEEYPDLVKSSMEKVLEETKNAKLRQRANAVMARIAS